MPPTFDECSAKCSALATGGPLTGGSDIIGHFDNPIANKVNNVVPYY